ncbi:MAG: hypothetical protein Q8868_01025 [Bacteroidota bacterium]|nr:hypothetical protein [Bacteroidota bacterium]
MNKFLISSILLLTVSCAAWKNTSFSSQNLDGEWIPVKQEIGGKELPKAAFENQKLIINDRNYTLIAESTDKGLIKFNKGKMDIFGREGVNAGKHFTAIYKFENGLFIICYNLLGDSYPVKFETKSKPTLFLSEFSKK